MQQEAKECPAPLILMVEDQATIRRMTSRMLSSMGYCILEASNGQEGLDLFRSRQEDIALVILDLTMPVMDGRDVFYRIREIKPSVKVIFMSGYPRPDLVDELLGEGIAGFLQKPFPIDELSDMIRRLTEPESCGPR